MLRIFADSGSSIKQEEKEQYNVEILPLHITLGDREYLDGIDLSMDIFYKALIEEKLFPTTSLPSLGEAEERINACTQQGDDVIILTISSGISGTYNTLKMLFAENPKVRVIDSKSAVGGMRILVEEINRHREESLDQLEQRLLKLIPRIRVCAIPETLDYLQRGGRLSKTAWVFGSMLQLKPLIALDSSDGSVKVLGKVRGLKKAMQALTEYLEKCECDPDYPIVPSYTYNSGNLDTLISMTDEKYHKQMIAYDNLDPAIACHWGPNAFGYIFVAGNQNRSLTP